MWRLYLDGETLKDIGEQYGLSKQRVAQIFEKAGYETRSRSYRKVTGNEIIAKEETP